MSTISLLAISLLGSHLRGVNGELGGGGATACFAVCPNGKRTAPYGEDCRDFGKGSWDDPYLCNASLQTFAKNKIEEVCGTMDGVYLTGKTFGVPGQLNLDEGYMKECIAFVTDMNSQLELAAVDDNDINRFRRFLLDSIQEDSNNRQLFLEMDQEDQDRYLALTDRIDRILGEVSDAKDEVLKATQCGCTSLADTLFDYVVGEVTGGVEDTDTICSTAANAILNLGMKQVPIIGDLCYGRRRLREKVDYHLEALKEEIKLLKLEISSLELEISSLEEIKTEGENEKHRRLSRRLSIFGSLFTRGQCVLFHIPQHYLLYRFLKYSLILNYTLQRRNISRT